MKHPLRTLLGLLVGTSLLMGVVAPGSARADGLQDRVTAGSAYASSRGTTIALAVLDRATGRYRDNGAVAHRPIESASVMKVFIAEDLLHRRDLGQISLSPSDLDDMVRMLRSSYNPAANRFWSTYGANDIVRHVIARYGLVETGLTSDVRYWGNTPITAHDMVVFYQRLLAGAGGLSTGSRGFIVDQLRRSTPWAANGDWQFFGLHDGLPREPIIGQKQGWMCCINGGIYRHSTGFVGSDARYIAVALTEEAATSGAAHIERSLTGAVQHMFPEGLIPRARNVSAETGYRLDRADGPPGPLLTAAPSPPAPAGADVVRAVGRLPDGSANGTLVVSYSSLGELRGDLHGTCTHRGDATTITGTSATARLTLSFDGSGAHVDLTDAGVTQSSQLAAGSHQVAPPRLVVNTRLLGGGALAGTLALDVVCNGAAG